MVRGSLSVARTLESRKFRAFRAGGQLAWSGGGVVLICRELDPPANGELQFCILEAYVASSNAVESAENGLESATAANTREKTALFALVGEVPEKARALLLRRVQDAASVGRRFALAADAFDHSD